MFSKDTISKVTKEYLEAVKSAFDYYSPVYSGLKQIKKDNPKLFLALILAIVILPILTFFIASSVYGRTEPKSTLGATTQSQSLNFFTVQETNQDQDNKIDGLAGQSGEKLLDTLKTVVEFYKPVFDTFVTSTPDVTGLSGEMINFSKGQINAGKFYTDLIMPLIWSVYILFLIFEGVLIILNLDKSSWSGGEVIKRHAITVFMLGFTPVILSLSIQFTNLLAREFLDNQNLSQFLLSYIEKARGAFDGGDPNDPLNWIKGIIGTGQAIGNPTEYFNEMLLSLTIIGPIFLIVILFLIIIMQFILRLVTLLFLFVLYPFVIVFYALPIKTGFQTKYFQTWTTYLIHVPAFALGFRIMRDIINQMIGQGGNVSAEQIAIMIGFLLFLCRVNVVVAEIFGNVYSVVQNNKVAERFSALAGLSTAASFAGSAVKTGAGIATAGAGLSIAKSEVRENQILSNQQRFQSPIKSSSISSFTRSNPNKGAAGNVELKDPLQSKHAQEFVNKGFEVNSVDPKEGVIGLSGQFYAYDNEKTGITTLYTSPEEAKQDFIKPSELYKVDGQNFNVVDTMNYKGRDNYNTRTNSSLDENAKPKAIYENLRNNQSENQSRGVQGVTVTRFPKDGTDRRINQTYVYTNSIKK